MANYSNLKTAIENAVDWNNGDNEITGQNLLDILETIIDSLGAKYKFADVATPSSSITTPDEPLFYLAGAGTYTNFSGLSVTIPRGTLAIFYYDTAWHYTTVRTDSDAFFNVNQNQGTPSTTYTKANARNAVPEALRSKGMIITYLTTNGWIIEQNLSTSGTWNADANWQTIGPVSVSQNTGTGGVDLSFANTIYSLARQRATMLHFGYNINYDLLGTTEEEFLPEQIINNGQIIDRYANATSLVFVKEDDSEVTINASDLPYKATDKFKGVKTASGTLSYVTIHVRGRLQDANRIYSDIETKSIGMQLKGHKEGESVTVSTTSGWYFAGLLNNKGKIGINLISNITLYVGVYDYTANVFLIPQGTEWKGWQYLDIPNNNHTIQLSIRSASGTPSVELQVVEESELSNAIGNTLNELLAMKTSTLNSLFGHKVGSTVTIATTSSWYLEDLLNNKGSIGIYFKTTATIYGGIYDATDNKFLTPQPKSLTGWMFVDIPQGHSIWVSLRSASGTPTVEMYVVENSDLIKTIGDSFKEDTDVITVGSGKMFPTLRSACNYAITKKNMKVIVYPGTYDLLTEFAASISSYSADKDGCRVGNGMHLIFMTGAKVTCNYTSSGNNTQDLWVFERFNPIWCDNSDFTIENLNIECQNTRYCVHDEGAGQGIYTHKYINCVMKYTNTSGLKTYKQCIGGGLGQNCHIVIDGGIFESVPYSGDELPISYHNGDNANAESNIYIKDIYLVGNGRLRFGAYGPSTNVSKAIVCGCSMGDSILNQQEQTGGTATLFELTEWNNIVRS